MNWFPEPADSSARYQPLALILIAFIAGIILDRVLSSSLLVCWSAAAGCWTCWLIAICIRQDRIGCGMLLLSILFSGATWHHWCWNLYREDEVARFCSELGSPVCVEAIARSEVRRLPPRAAEGRNRHPAHVQTAVTVRVRKLRDGAHWKRVSGTVVMQVAGQLEGVQFGDRLRICGWIRRPRASRNPGQFEYWTYLRTQRQLCQLSVAHSECVQRLTSGRWYLPGRVICELRSHCLAVLHRHLPPDRAPLAAAMLVGARYQIDRGRNEQFLTTGTVHLLAISGLHVGILASMWWFAARINLLSREQALLMTCVFVFCYAIFTDAKPPVIRAAVLIIVFCAARWLGRPALSMNTLSAAALTVLILNPAQLFQVGTQLSFLAVAALSLFGSRLVRPWPADPLARLIQSSRPWPIRFARRMFWIVIRLWATSALIWIVTMPLVAYRFHVVSPISVMLNPILMIPVALTLFTGFALLVVGGFWPIAGDLLGMLCSFNLWAIESCIQLSRPLTGSHLFVAVPGVWWVAGCYVGLTLMAVSGRCRRFQYWCLVLLLAWLATGLYSADRSTMVFDSRGATMTCTFIDVGHGTCVVLELPDGSTMLYDAGRLGGGSSAGQAITRVLLANGITHLDAIILSHADSDHYNALPEIMDRISIGIVYVSPVMFREPTADGLHRLRERLFEKGRAIGEISYSDRFRLSGGVSMRVLHPRRRGVEGSDNANSVVLEIVYQGIRILLPGDLEAAGMQQLLEHPPLDCDVVMAPHHGSSRSDPDAFLRWSSPRSVIVSGGRGLDWGPLKAAAADRGASVLPTAEYGAIRVTIRDQRLVIQTWRDGF